MIAMERGGISLEVLYAFMGELELFNFNVTYEPDKIVVLLLESSLSAQRYSGKLYMPSLFATERPSSG